MQHYSDLFSYCNFLLLLYKKCFVWTLSSLWFHIALDPSLPLYILKGVSFYCPTNGGLFLRADWFHHFRPLMDALLAMAKPLYNWIVVV